MASSPLLVGAIDFGTTYSGWAFSFKHEFESDRTLGTVKHWHTGSDTLTTEKTPTCVLVRPDGKTLLAFGYEAENIYRELIEADEHKHYFYFKKFKMMLNKKLGENLDRGITLEDEMGRSLPALDVFSMAIKYLKCDMLQIIAIRQTGIIKQTDIIWVLTVPAIWTDGAKQFMREAAIKAGIENDHLMIALEPEAASLFCRNVPVEALVDEYAVKVAQFKAGTRYLILDAGGGTIDITVHEVEESGGVKEVHAACGGGWGGTIVDKAFENMLIDIFTKEVYESFKKEETDDWLDIWRGFEAKKRVISPDMHSDIRMKFPLSLLDLYMKVSRQKLSDDLKNSRFSNDISISGDKMKFVSELIKSLFDNAIVKTIEYVTDVMQDSEIKAILMVGGFSESPLLQHAVKSAFPGVDVVIPKNAASAILRGALIFGHSPESITERILKYTYGIRTRRKFIDGKHPESKRTKTDTGDYCSDTFSKHVEKHQRVKVGKPQIEKTYAPLNKTSKVLSFPVYASEMKDPLYTDQGCIYLGKMTVELADHDGDLNRKVYVSLTFSGTEIIVTAKDMKTGSKTNARIDFLG